MQKTLFFILFAIIVTMTMSTGCTDRKTDSNDSLYGDSLDVDTTKSDSIELIIAEEPMPKSADELFDDFFFNFAANKKLQRERIIFPLTCISNGSVSTIQKNAWSMERFHMRLGYTSLIYNTKKQGTLQKNTAISSVYVEKIAMTQQTVKRWHFVRTDGLWRMNKIETFPVAKHEDAGFINFYHSFVTDSVAQANSLAEIIEFSGPDPDDDFSRIEGEIMAEQYPVFAPWLPSETLFNVHYGITPYKNTNTRILTIRGVANGLDTELTFSLIDGKWTLVKFES